MIALQHCYYFSIFTFLWVKRTLSFFFNCLYTTVENSYSVLLTHTHDLDNESYNSRQTHTKVKDSFFSVKSNCITKLCFLTKILWTWNSKRNRKTLWKLNLSLDYRYILWHKNLLSFRIKSSIISLDQRHYPRKITFERQMFKFPDLRVIPIPCWRVEWPQIINRRCGRL